MDIRLVTARCVWFCISIACLCVHSACTFGMAPRPAASIPIEFIQADVHTDSTRLNVDLLIPNATRYKALSRIEVRVVRASSGKTVFGAVLNMNRQNKCDPIPPEAFGVLKDPESEDRSIENVQSAGLNGQWDQEGTGGILLAESAHGFTGPDLGIRFAIQPDDWPEGPYEIQARACRPFSTSEPWKTIAIVGKQKEKES